VGQAATSAGQDAALRYVEALEREIGSLRAERDRWKAMARKWQARSRENKRALDALTAVYGSPEAVVEEISADV
jgi:hypothetical protein